MTGLMPRRSPFWQSVTALLILPVFGLATSCSFASSSTQSIAVQPTHENADVFVDGRLVGRGTRSVEMHKRRGHVVMAKCGGSVGIAQVDRSISTSGILDLIGGVIILVPFLGALAPGFWRLDPPMVVVVIPDTSKCEIPEVEPEAPSS